MTSIRTAAALLALSLPLAALAAGQTGNSRPNGQMPPPKCGQMPKDGQSKPPMPPKDGQTSGRQQNSQRPPEPPKDANGNPLPPPACDKAGSSDSR